MYILFILLCNFCSATINVNAIDYRNAEFHSSLKDESDGSSEVLLLVKINKFIPTNKPNRDFIHHSGSTEEEDDFAHTSDSKETPFALEKQINCKGKNCAVNAPSLVSRETYSRSSESGLPNRKNCVGRNCPNSYWNEKKEDFLRGEKTCIGKNCFEDTSDIRNRNRNYDEREEELKCRGQECSDNVRVGKETLSETERGRDCNDHNCLTTRPNGKESHEETEGDNSCFGPNCMKTISDNNTEVSTAKSERRCYAHNCLESNSDTKEDLNEIKTHKVCIGRNCLKVTPDNKEIYLGAEKSRNLVSNLTPDKDLEIKCSGRNCVTFSEEGRDPRICEIKYAEYMANIFPGDDDRADANDLEFHGRTLAEPGEYPHMAALGYRTSGNDWDFKCGGSLISENFVITAAHCTNITGQEPTTVRIGDLNLLVDEKYLEPQLHKIRRIRIHPQYNSDSNYYDIALLELSSSVKFTEFVRPIRLWVSHEIPYNTAHAAGYGATAFGKARTNRLTALNLTIVPNGECDRVMPKLPETQNGIIDSQICARDYERNRDTCQGDSGGPLQLNLYGRRRQNRKHYHLIGITSYGLACRNGFPGVYTRISSFLDWIEEIVWGAH